MSDQHDNAELSELLRIYYKLFFPYNLFYKWLSYGDENYFENREFSFTLAGDIYIRFLSFADGADLEKCVQDKQPEKIDVGAVYNSKPKDSKNGLLAFKPLERELVFDIDMTDYDDVRTCCKGADICLSCWPFMTIAAKILDRALREDFGFKHLFWVYSGRRGIHCWVADERARKLSPEARSAIGSYLSIIEGGEYKKKKVNLSEMIHPSIVEALKIIDDQKHFDSLILEKQKLLETKQQIEEIIELIPDLNVREFVSEQMFSRKLKSSAENWYTLMSIIDSTKKSSLHIDEIKLQRYIGEIKLQLCYPRLDINVTKGINHLLKVPFSVHPKTGRICVPIDINKINKFNPLTVPTIKALCAQIDAYDSKTGSTQETKKVAYEKTNLAASITLFQNFANNLVKPSDPAKHLKF